MKALNGTELFEDQTAAAKSLNGFSSFFNSKSDLASVIDVHSRAQHSTAAANGIIESSNEDLEEKDLGNIIRMLFFKER
jgi:hypothetical protein